MSGPETIADQAARARALDPNTSFIVQAPAGSGKTGLLSQRFLRLLAGVDAPEEIVAITFTRKAASEMRQRILSALEQAGSNAAPDSDHERHTWELAQHALARDRERGWQLLANPARLRIQTIDSLCAALARQMPILSRFGAVPAIAEDASPLYLDAARNTIAELESEAAWSDAIAHLVQHLDNRLDKLQDLISTMLARRDQWLRHIADPNHAALARETLEAAMANLVSDALALVSPQIPDTCVPELLNLARFAASQTADQAAPIVACLDLQMLPGAQVTERRQWEGLAALLLTGDGSWRKRITKNEGFPAAGNAKNAQEKALFDNMKQRMVALLKALESAEPLRVALAAMRALPPHRYTDEQWATLQALITALRVAAAHLELVFGARGQVDFPALVQAAIQALGAPQAPTDLALALDYRIRHLLVDEFQDTSFNQYELLKRLTAGWQAHDGHTLFVVGDPMQSIYRFREAEVGLFLAARAHGIGQVPLEFLRLMVNFRSQQGIVDWINEKFPQVLAAHDNVAAGAVSYAPSTARHALLPAPAVTVYPALVNDKTAEAQQVVAIVQQARREHAHGTTAILVRGRSHLTEVVAALQQAKLRFQAVEIERLAHRPVVQDLLALTRALCHAGDRIAWLALLRAPYCGLTLADLYLLAGDDSERTLIDLLHEAARVEQLSAAGRQRLARVLPVLDTALAERARSSLRAAVEGVWIALGGPACVADATDLEDGEVYLQLLENLGTGGALPDVHELNQHVEQLFALPDVAANNALQLMTMHKAKGLEFDTVILPGLGRKPRHDEEKLLQWLERSRESGESDLLLAPISAQGEDKNPMATYLQGLAQAKGRYEDGRLLYVAATRARQRLHLLGHVTVQEREGSAVLAPPQAGSLLACLWPVVAPDFQSAFARHADTAALLQDRIAPSLAAQPRSLLAPDWTAPPPPPGVVLAGAVAERAPGELLEFDWAGETARHVGTVVHRLLQHLGKTGVDAPALPDMQSFPRIARTLLLRLGVPQGHLGVALAKVTAAMQAVVQDQRGQWILSNRHADARCELALSGVRAGWVNHLVIDRTFVDEHGTRWIIDYKTGAHSGGGIEAFLDREQERYRPQLERYADIMRHLDSRPIRLGLYFPLLGGWREWSSDT